jgi:hypothetical protein
VSEAVVAMPEGRTGGFDTIEELRAIGFEGFATVSDLIGSRCAEVPVARGVYVVVRDGTAPPRFLPRSGAGHFRGQDPTVPVAELEARWIPGAILLYVGEAGGTGVRGQLQQRIKRRLRFAQGARVGAWGGRTLWQLADHRSLRFAWMPCEDPRGAEAHLLAAFQRRHGALPFANLSTEHEES